MIDKTCPCRSSYEHSQRYFWTLTPKKGLLSCQLTFFRLVVTMAESFCFCTTANGAHAHLIYAEDNILWFIFTRGWSVFNTGGGSTVLTQHSKFLSRNYPHPPHLIGSAFWNVRSYHPHYIQLFSPWYFYTLH